jgi:type IV pilus assembly protein PilA
MLARIQKSMKEKDQGFTLIELLVVIIIIGILAAIAIPVFLNQRQKGYKADMKSALKNMATAIESAATETGGDYAGQTTALLEANEGFHYSATLSPVVDDADANGYCLSVTDTRLDNGATSFFYSSDTGVPAEGTCP